MIGLGYGMYMPDVHVVYHISRYNDRNILQTSAILPDFPPGLLFSYQAPFRLKYEQSDVVISTLIIVRVNTVLQLTPTCWIISSSFIKIVIILY